MQGCVHLGRARTLKRHHPFCWHTAQCLARVSEKATEIVRPKGSKPQLAKMVRTMSLCLNDSRIVLADQTPVTNAAQTEMERPAPGGNNSATGSQPQPAASIICEPICKSRSLHQYFGGKSNDKGKKHSCFANRFANYCRSINNLQTGLQIIAAGAWTRKFICRWVPSWAEACPAGLLDAASKLAAQVNLQAWLWLGG